MNHTFCTDLSREQNDPLAGSAAHAEHNLLISWPRSKWTRHLRRASNMPDTLIHTLDAIADSGRRINLIHQQGLDENIHHVFLMPERRRFTVPRDQLEVFLAAWQAQSPLTEWETGYVDKELVLCCTHGKKDKCCAKYGYQTYKALAQTISDHQLAFEVWESSHLGGCRFAASLILLSPVRKYGRITPQQALPFLQAEARGQRYLPCYRGASRLTPAQQCAQLAALTFLERQNLTPDLMLLKDTGDEQQRHLLWRWMQKDAYGQVQVTCETTAIMRVDQCSDLYNGPTESLVWRAIEVKALR